MTKHPQSRFLIALKKPRKTIWDFLPAHKKSKISNTIVKGVFKGNFYRVKLPEMPLKRRFDMPKLGLPPPIPSPFVKETISNEQSSGSEQDYFQFFNEWWKNNWTVLVLNFGSLCTLTGFTRSDVLELRTLSTMGSLSFVLYNTSQTPLRWLPIAWSSLFATVNSIKILQILHERKARVVLTEQQQAIFINYFMPHGVTPKQFEMVWNKAKLVTRYRGDIITMAGTPMTHIALVIQGTTKANILGRHLTAASSAPSSKQKVGGDSGAWIGEMAFLEQTFENERRFKASATEHDEEPSLVLPRSRNAIHTIVATEDCVLLEWTHRDMEELMGRSIDMNAAMTRAMTAAIVGKVINFTVSRTTTTTSPSPTWSTWLYDWSHNAGAKEAVVDDNVANDADEQESNPIPPTSSALKPAEDLQ